MQNVALARQQVVVDIDSRHCSKMAARDGHRHRFGHTSRIVVAFFDLLQRLSAKVVFRIVGLVKRRDSRVDIPAVVIEFHGGVGNDPADIVESFLLNMLEAHNHVGDLNPGIVDVILHFDFAPRRLENSNKCVSYRGISKMANVGRFIGVDVRVFDNNLARVRGKSTKAATAYGSGPVQENVDISCARHLHPFDTVDLSGPRDQFLGNHPRGLLDLPRQFERDRSREFAKLNFRSLIENHFRGVDIPLRPDGAPKRVL